MFTLYNEKKIYCKKFFKSIGGVFDNNYKNIYYLSCEGKIINLLKYLCKIIEISDIMREKLLFDYDWDKGILKNVLRINTTYTGYNTEICKIDNEIIFPPNMTLIDLLALENY